ncbi:hypothetical protein KZZ52_58235 [Dactylosporangium sp. AC04546]|uniref:hypothetical protein n=1 Tax=Dactylosporangium sp. AC04546 TaxID=2862460 RepID=UPI001EDEF40F|nr:hypothetical protein [Dactylosporangium sp. AC04546]WVK83538.1 hypothetical protein KZZ52_58235 [Dactylosporangium sp. AC04546]
MTAPAPRHDAYYLLSHVRGSVPDRWVGQFNHALELAIGERASPPRGLQIEGLYYETTAAARQQRRPGTPLGARVLVPLYTREFLHEAPPEYDDFCNNRLGGGARPRIHPVFWDANPGGRDVPGFRQARSLGEDLPEYEECGLAAMCRLNGFVREYRIIIGRLADRIVEAAEHPARLPAWGAADAATEPGFAGTETLFVVSVLADGWRTWNPFGDDAAGPLVDSIARLARALVLPPEVVEYDEAEDWIQESPGVLLVDLWALESEQLRGRVQRALREPPRWASVLAVAVHRDAEHDERRKAIIATAEQLVGHPLTPVSDQYGFEAEIPEVVQRTRRSYLRRQPINPRHRPGRGDG